MNHSLTIYDYRASELEQFTLSVCITCEKITEGQLRVNFQQRFRELINKQHFGIVVAA